MKRKEGMRLADWTLPTYVAEALRTLESRGFEAYIVGGCVRDRLMGRVPDDYDLATSARPDETAVCFADRRVIKTGFKHGTVAVMMGDKPVEITTFRVDGAYPDHRHPASVAFSRALRDDLVRRDFTVNAMAYRPQSGLIDLFGGRADILRKRVACVGDARERFNEDALRILRALRFAATLGFEIEPNTRRAIYEKRGLLGGISAERLLAEMRKLVAGPDARRILLEYRETTRVFAPEIRPLPDGAPDDPGIRWALLFDGEAAARGALTRLRADNGMIRDVCLLAAAASEPPPDDDLALRRLIGRIGARDAKRCALAACAARGEIGRAETLANAVDRLARQGACQSPRALHIDGRDLTALGLSGSAVGRALKIIYREVVETRLPNDRESLLGRAREIAEKETDQ